MNRVIKTVAVITFGLMVSACATEPAEPELVVDGEEWECRRVHEVGSRLGKKICGSPETWAKHDAEEADTASDTHRRLREKARDMTSDVGM